MVSERHWTRDWVLSGQPDWQSSWEIRMRSPGELYALELSLRLCVAPASLIVSQTTTEAN